MTTKSYSKNSRWPWWAQTLALCALPGDRGVGDTAARLIGDEASAAYKAWHARLFGEDCRCDHRRETWNSAYSYMEGEN